MTVPDIYTCVNGHQWAAGQSLSPPVSPESVCPTCGATGETLTEDLLAALTAVDGELPPPPSPLPDAVVQVAAGLLLGPEQTGRAGLPTVGGYEILGLLGR